MFRSPKLATFPRAILALPGPSEFDGVHDGQLTAVHDPFAHEKFVHGLDVGHPIGGPTHRVMDQFLHDVGRVQMFAPNQTAARDRLKKRGLAARLCRRG